MTTFTCRHRHLWVESCQYPPRYPRIDADQDGYPGGDLTRLLPSVTTLGWSHHQNARFAKQPHLRLSPSFALARVAQWFAHAHRAPGLCEAVPQATVSSTFHAAYSRSAPRDALPACNRFGLSDGSPPECVVIAQIAHRKYAVRYATLVGILGRTGRKFALRFADLACTLSYVNYAGWGRGESVIGRASRNGDKTSHQSRQLYARHLITTLATNADNFHAITLR